MKKIILVSTLILFTIGGARLVNAEEIFPDENAPIVSDEGAPYLNTANTILDLEEDLEEYPIENKNPNSRLIMYTYYKIESKTSAGTSMGPWRDGPSGKGQATIAATNGNTKNRSVTSSISGDYPIGKGKIGASLGVTIGSSESFSVSYSRVIPKGKREQIIFRPVYKLTKVKQRLYTQGVPQKTVSTATVKSFSHWDYSFKTI